MWRKLRRLDATQRHLNAGRPDNEPTGSGRSVIFSIGTLNFSESKASMSTNHFQLLGLPTQFTIDLNLLDQHYRRVQGEVHPDRFTAGSAAEKLQSMQLATMANEAYQTLKRPTARARYLLQLQGLDLEEESNTSMPGDFLMLQMEWHEAIDTAVAESNPAALDQLLLEIRGTATQMQEQLQRLIDQDKNYVAAVEIVRKLSFIDRIRQEIEQKLAGLEA